MQEVHNYSKSPTQRDNTTAIARGIILVLVGTALLLHQIPETRYILPNWLFGIHSIFVIVGIYNGIKNRFQNVAWVIFILIGVMIFLHKYEIMGAQNLFIYALPFSLIIVGLFLIFNRK